VQLLLLLGQQTRCTSSPKHLPIFTSLPPLTQIHYAVVFGQSIYQKITVSLGAYLLGRLHILEAKSLPDVPEISSNKVALIAKA